MKNIYKKNKKKKIKPLKRNKMYLKFINKNNKNIIVNIYVKMMMIKIKENFCEIITTY